jgi:hypothetical protein
MQLTKFLIIISEIMTWNYLPLPGKPIPFNGVR